MAWVAAVAVLALIEYLVFSMFVGWARGRYGVEAPATTGDPVFERYFRVHQNTLEQLVVFLPALFLFATWVSPTWAAWIGLAFPIGRLIYFRSYVSDPKSRGVGFGIGYLANAALVIGSAVGVVLGLL